MAGKLIARSLTAGAKPTQRVDEARRLGFDPDRVFYHGTKQSFEEFDPKKISEKGGNFGKGFYFSELPEKANVFATSGMSGANRRRPLRDVQIGSKEAATEPREELSGIQKMIARTMDKLGRQDPAPNILPVHLNMKNPLILETDQMDDSLGALGQLEKMFGNAAYSDDISSVVQKAGYDGVVVRNPQGTILEGVVYKPNQVRSVFADFDPKSAKSGDLLASFDPITAGSLGALALEGGQQAFDYVQQNLDPQTIRDYGLAAASMIPGPQMIPAAAIQAGILATDAATYLADPENRGALVESLTALPEQPSTSGQMKRNAPQNFAEGGVVTLKDRAVNMNRGPRSNGIMQYVPYITGATNGY